MIGHVIRSAEETVHTAVKVLLPVPVWAALTVFGVVLRYGFPAYRPLAAGLAIAAGIVLAGLDAYLRNSRAHLVGRWIGPVTVLVAVAFLAAFLLAGYSPFLGLAYLVAGAGTWAGRAAWMGHGDRRDLATAFAASAPHIADGRLAGTRLFHAVGVYGL